MLSTEDLIQKLRDYSKRLERKMRTLRDEAHDQHDCCHGQGAAEILEDAADACAAIALELDRYSVDLEREATRVAP